MHVPILLRCLTHLDILKCDHGGVVDMLPGTMSAKKARAESGHVLTEDELLKFAIERCPIKGPLPARPCKRVLAVLTGRAMHAHADKKILLLENLVATTDGIGPGIVKLAPDLFSMIALHEGAKPKVYPDSRGIKTIGLGLNMERDPATLKRTFAGMGLDYQHLLDGKQALTELQMRQLAQANLIEHTNRARRRITNFDLLSAERQNALVDLAFNGALYDSVATLVNQGKFAEAADRLYQVRPYRDIQPRRTARVMALLKASYVLAMPE